ncbi:MAG: YibE/F family protein, partial [Rhodococcus sp.]|nr:YibE/F family protein [Rhodococcus sp. (in: high G+C Gram-positive bacteria)]
MEPHGTQPSDGISPGSTSHVGHGHGHSDSPVPLGPVAAKVVVGLLIAIAIAVIAGAFALWPSKQSIDIPLPFQTSGGGAVSTEA